MSESQRSPATRSSRIQRLPYDAGAMDRIAETLGLEARPAPFRFPGGDVYQLLVPGTLDRPAALVTLWPSIKRVDVISATATVVFTSIASVDLVPGVEVLFRRGSGEYLIVARGGKVIVRS